LVRLLLSAKSDPTATAWYTLIATCPDAFKYSIGGNVTRPRAADDFTAIRARLEELRRERADALTNPEANLMIGPRPYAVGGRSLLTNKSKPIPLHLQRIFRSE
jgi:hypothetical protein